MCLAPLFHHGPCPLCAGSLDDQVSGMMEALEQIRDTLSDLMALYPESLDYADENDD